MENLIIYAFIYLLGSIPFGLILAKFFAKTDIKKEGSKSIGATNVLRVVKEKNPKLAKKLAIATIILDFAKAAIPLLILKFLHYDQALLWSVAVLAIFG
ncbi:glycerol-3-phosphate acyltransferase, partial [Campylobacter jejuni]